MSLEITGTIEKVLPLESGVTKAGADWQKQNFIVTNNDGYNDQKQIFCFEIFGEEKVQNFNKFNKEGSTVKVDFNISTNEWNGKYFTSLQAWKVFKQESNEPAPKSESFVPSANLNEEEPDDLPF
jgi:hypothetical protein